MKRLHSEIGRKQMGDGTKTGTQLGELAATTGLNMAVAVMDEMRLARTPHENTQRLVQWMKLSSDVTAVITMGIGAPIAKATFGQTADLPKALAGVEKLLMPAPDFLLAQGVNALWHKTKHRSETASSAELILDVYVLFLSKWPGDVAIAVLSETYEWFPTQHDLEKRMQRHAEPRRLFASRLRTAIAERDAPDAPEKPVNAPVARPDDAQAIADSVQYFRRGGKDAPAVETDEEFIHRIQSDKRGPRPETLRTIGLETLNRVNMKG